MFIERTSGAISRLHRIHIGIALVQNGAAMERLYIDAISFEKKNKSGIAGCGIEGKACRALLLCKQILADRFAPNVLRFHD